MLSDTIVAAQRVILSVGSGDGSQQASIYRSGHRNLCTTFYDEEREVLARYPTLAADNIAVLRKASTVLFQVDATRLHLHQDLKDRKFDLILFSFPHSGIPNSASHSIESNKTLIRKFLSSAQHIVRVGGEICVTLKTTSRYDKWTFPDFGKFTIEPKSQSQFNQTMFPGYVHRSTRGEVNGVARVSNGDAITYTFGTKKSNGGSDQPSSDSSVSFNGLAVKVTLLLCQITDGDVEDRVKTIIGDSPSAKRLDVLEIRRKFCEASKPDTRQLNRILYDMHQRNILRKCPPVPAKNKKPTWALNRSVGDN